MGTCSLDSENGVAEELYRASRELRRSKQGKVAMPEQTMSAVMGLFR